MGFFDNLIKAVESGSIEDRLSHALDKFESGVNKMDKVEDAVKGASEAATDTSAAKPSSANKAAETQ